MLYGWLLPLVPLAGLALLASLTITSYGLTDLHGILAPQPTPAPERFTSFLRPPTSVATNQQVTSEEDQQDRPQDIASKPRQEAQVLEQVVGADHDQRPSPKPAATPPAPRAIPAPRPVPAAGVSLPAPVVVLLVSPCPPLVPRGAGARLLRRPVRMLGRRWLGGHGSHRTRGPAGTF